MTNTKQIRGFENDAIYLKKLTEKKEYKNISVTLNRIIKMIKRLNIENEII